MADPKSYTLKLNPEPCTLAASAHLGAIKRGAPVHGIVREVVQEHRGGQPAQAALCVPARQLPVAALSPPPAPLDPWSNPRPLDPLQGLNPRPYRA